MSESGKAAIVAGMMDLAGVYRVLCFASQRKLSLRYDEAALSERQVILKLAAVLASLPPPSSAPSSVGAAGRKSALSALPKIAGAGQKLLEKGWTAAENAVERVNPASRGKNLPFDAKEWGVHFINDLVAFYLIRVHWTRITKQWLPDPWAFRYQWLTIIYLTFVLVRYRKASLKKNAAK